MKLIWTSITETYYFIKNRVIDLLDLRSWVYSRDCKNFYDTIKKHGKDLDD